MQQWVFRVSLPWEGEAASDARRRLWRSMIDNRKSVRVPRQLRRRLSYTEQRAGDGVIAVVQPGYIVSISIIIVVVIFIALMIDTISKQ